MAERIQRSRAKGWRMPENTVCVDRSTALGNPFPCNWDANGGGWCPKTPQGEGETYCCIETYRHWIETGLRGEPSRTGVLVGAADAMNGYPMRTKAVQALPRIRGKNVACWCSLDRPCHADVLLEIANDTPARAQHQEEQ